MCIVIDVNRLPSVLSTKSQDHVEYVPILDWIRRRRTKIVYGGTEYTRQLKEMKRYFRILQEMSRAGQVKVLDKDTVDLIQAEIDQRTTSENSNDPFIVAIIIVSKCKLLCSNDTASFSFIRNRSLYPNGIKPPKIYRDQRDRQLLYHRHIAGRCGPCCR